MRNMPLLPSRPFCTFRHELSSLPRTISRRRTAKVPRGVERRQGTADDHPRGDHGGTQQRYDHRLRNLVQGTGDVTVATDLGVLRSTARGWLGEARTVVVCWDVADLSEP